MVVMIMMMMMMMITTIFAMMVKLIDDMMMMMMMMMTMTGMSLNDVNGSLLGFRVTQWDTKNMHLPFPSVIRMIPSRDRSGR